MFFFAGRNDQVRLVEHDAMAIDALTTPFEDWCTRERRDPEAPDSWLDFELARLLDPDGAASGAA